MAKYTLPDLSYDYGALAPHISGRIMELHHSKHHANYVKGANTALEQLAELGESGDTAKIAAVERALAFNVSGHVLHSIFWRNLAPKAGGKPDGELAQVIDRDFGSFERFKKLLNGAAASIMGSGWAALTWDPLVKRLVVTQIYDHQSNVTQAGVPILVVDAWEHAFYLQYENRKAEFFDAVWNLWNWRDVAERLAAAKKLDALVPGAVSAT
ncbi:superoxide dismutase [Myxococcota bacterium]|nr:superoxide dismutase [Myxococcota bacterium]